MTEGVVPGRRGQRLEGLHPRRHQGLRYDEERYADGVRRTATVFLTGAECRFSCVFCDLWRYTLEGPTPAGAIPHQLQAALHEIDDVERDGRGIEQIKLYNASNFFDEQAVPESDDQALLGLLGDGRRVTVEHHPVHLLANQAWRRCRRYAECLEGRLEVAMGLESAHPEAARRLRKGSDLATFERACERLRELGVAVRAFVVVGLPLGTPAEREAWAVRSVGAALRAGAALVSLVPLRIETDSEPGAARGEWRSATLDEVERVLARSLTLEMEPRLHANAGFCEAGSCAAAGGTVQVDPWDVAGLSAERACADCQRRRRERLLAANRSGRWPGALRCASGRCPSV